MAQLKLTFASAMCMLVGCGPSGVQGDGHSQSETRVLGPFSSIEADTDIDVVVSESTSQSVVVTADENLVPLITTRVGGSTLFIGQQDGLRPRAASVVTVSIPTLRVAELDGAGSMTVGDFTEVDLQLVANGSGDLTANIRANALDVSMPSSGDVNLSGQTAALTLSSTGFRLRAGHRARRRRGYCQARWKWGRVAHRRRGIHAGGDWFRVDQRGARRRRHPTVGVRFWLDHVVRRREGTQRESDGLGENRPPLTAGSRDGGSSDAPRWQ